MQHQGYNKILHIAQERLKDHFDYVDFDSNETITQHIREIFATDALLEAGSSISIRWLSTEEQKSRLDGIEDMMFDDIIKKPGLMDFYKEIIEANTILRGNRLVFKSHFVHPHHANNLL